MNTAYRRQMKQAHSAAAAKKRKALQAPDPRFAALARLLARHAARRDFEKALNSGTGTQGEAQGGTQEELIGPQDGAYDSGSASQDDAS